MTTVPTPPLLIDNEQLREIMRQREEWAPERFVAALVPALLKPEQRAALAAIASQPMAAQRQWPGVLRQLHWELCSSTNLRPIARIMNKMALLPDPALVQGGFCRGSDTLAAQVLPQHPHTQLHTLLRLDIVLSGASAVAVNGTALGNLQAGDALLSEVWDQRAFADADSLLLWSSFYYSPDTCCCRARGPLCPEPARPVR